MKESKSLLKIKRAVCYLVLCCLTLICLFSFYVLIINATRAHADIQKGFSFLPGKSLLTNLKNVLQNKNLPVMRGTLNSLLVSSTSAALTTYFSAMTAYAIHAYHFKFKKAVFLFIMMIMMIPQQVTTLGFISLMRNMKLMDNLLPLIIPSIAAPVVFYFMKSYMESSLPLEIVEASRIDGSGELRTFNHIIIPMMKPALAVQAIFAFVGAWNNYFVPSLIIKSDGKKTLPILIAQLRSADFLKFDMGQVYTLIAIAIVPVIIVYLFLSKFIIRGITVGAVKG